MDVLEDSGVATAHVVVLDCPGSAKSSALDLPGEVAKPPLSDRPMAIPDTAVNSLNLLEALERAAGCPVVTANQASLWAGLCLLGRSTWIPRAGRLFAL